jgi:hypothetical protein
MQQGLTKIKNNIGLDIKSQRGRFSLTPLRFLNDIPVDAGEAFDLPHGQSGAFQRL